MNKSLVALAVGAFVLGSGALMAQQAKTPIEKAESVPQTSPEQTAKLKAEREAAKAAEAKMTPEEKAAAKKAKRAQKQKEHSQIEKVGNPNAPAKAEAVEKTTAATKHHPKPLPDTQSKQEALTKQSSDPPGHYPAPPSPK